jgi:hypothetical protein
MKLVARSAAGPETQGTQDFLHGDLGAKYVEIDTWHGDT